MKDSVNFTTNKNVEDALNYISKPTDANNIPDNEPAPPPVPPEEATTKNTTEPSVAFEEINETVAAETAETLIYLLDFALTIICKFFARKKFENNAYEIAGENAAAKMKEVLLKVKRKETQLFDKEEAALRDLHEALEEYLKEVPLDEAEQKLLRKPLQEIVKIKHMKMSPSFTLMVSLAMIATSRIGGYTTF